MQRGAVERREQPLVGIDDERVGPFESGELVPDRGGEQGGAAVGAVDVEPQRALLGHVGHPGEIVDDAGVGRPGRGDNADDVVGPRVAAPGRPRSAAPVSRWSSVGTISASTPMTWSALPTEEWASSLTAISGRAGPCPPRR